MTRYFALTAAIVVAGIAFLAFPGAAPAQTATNLACKGCVGKKDLGRKAVNAGKLATNAVRTPHIRDGAVNAGKLAADAKPTGVDFAFNSVTPLALTETIIASTSIDVPSSGYVVATASSSFDFTGSTTTHVGCVVTDDIVAPPSTRVETAGDDDTIARQGLAQTRVFPVAAGTKTINWVCRRISGSSVVVQNTNLVAFFVPNRY